MRVIGYGICGPGEADRYMEKTLQEFKRLTDQTIILLNNATDKERKLVEKYGFLSIEDNREWGKNQNKIKQEFIKEHVSKLKPDITICLDMDEVFLETERSEIEKLPYPASYVYVLNLWDDGYRKDWSFWNVRIWRWDEYDKLGERFWEFENRPLHCGLAPKWCYYYNYHAPIVLLHYGLKKKSDRMKKVERYEKYDPKRIYREPEYYEALKSDRVDVLDIDKIKKDVKENITNLTQPLGKKLPMENKTKQYLVKREYDGMIISVKENVLDSQLKQKYNGMGFTLIQKDPIGMPKESEISEIECDVCGFKAKTVFGLRSHKRKHG